MLNFLNNQKKDPNSKIIVMGDFNMNRMKNWVFKLTWSEYDYEKWKKSLVGY